MVEPFAGIPKFAFSLRNYRGILSDSDSSWCKLALKIRIFAADSIVISYRQGLVQAGTQNSHFRCDSIVFFCFSSLLLAFKIRIFAAIL